MFPPPDEAVTTTVTPAPRVDAHRLVPFLDHLAPVLTDSGGVLILAAEGHYRVTVTAQTDDWAPTITATVTGEPTGYAPFAVPHGVVSQMGEPARALHPDYGLIAVGVLEALHRFEKSMPSLALGLPTLPTR